MILDSINTQQGLIGYVFIRFSLTFLIIFNISNLLCYKNSCHGIPFTPRALKIAVITVVYVITNLCLFQLDSLSINRTIIV